MRIAHFGTFDVENYGDLLFPLVLERRLAGRGHALTHVSPVGGSPIWEDCVETISIRDAMTQSFDGIIIGGGHIIHGHPSDLKAYRESEDRGLFAYADLWLGSTLRACELGVPIVWNSPGVPGHFLPETAELARWAAGQASYLAVRDATSRRFLAGTGFNGEISVELDTAVEVSELWSSEDLEAAWRDAFLARGNSLPERALVVHFTSRYLQDGVADAAARLDSLCRSWNLTPILLALGPCHGDSMLQREVACALTVPHCLIDSARSLREIAACIRGAELYVGSSLHGAVTARAFGRPAILVAREVEGGHAKFSDFVASDKSFGNTEAGGTATHVESWSAAWERAEQTLAIDSTRRRPDPSRDPRVGEALERHLKRLVDSLEARSVGNQSGGRTALEQLASIGSSRWNRDPAYVGILLDQAREAAKYRETAQRSSRRFRQLERIHRDLKESIRIAKARAGSVRSTTNDDGLS